jgi:hypothetical protein
MLIKENRGGRRPGAGRPRGGETRVVRLPVGLPMSPGDWPSAGSASATSKH